MSTGMGSDPARGLAPLLEDEDSFELQPPRLELGVERRERRLLLCDKCGKGRGEVPVRERRLLL